MDKASKITLDKTVKKMIDSELGFILLEADEKSIYAVSYTHLDVYKRQQWSLEDLPMMFPDWKIVPSQEPYKKERLKEIGKLLKSCEAVVHALSLIHILRRFIVGIIIFRCS